MLLGGRCNLVKVRSDYDDCTHDEIVSEGMLQRGIDWIPIEVSVSPEKETEKAYYADVLVYECDDFGRADVEYQRVDWLPKSMAQNPWWVLTKFFDFSGKVSNRGFDNYD